MLHFVEGREKCGNEKKKNWKEIEWRKVLLVEVEKRGNGRSL